MIEMRPARVAGPVPYESRRGATANLPYGPCLVEHTDGGRVDVVWGPNGEHSTALPLESMVDAAKRGALVLLD